MKKIISYFIKYHVSVNILILAFVIFGIMGFLSLKSSFFPLVPSKIITIQLIYPGASPQEMEEGVVLKIEENLKGLIGIDRFYSVSSENSALITIETLIGYNLDVVLADVKNAVDKVPSFPVGMEPPIIAKVEGIQRAITFVVTGKDIPLRTLKSAAREIESDLRNIDGISQVDIKGFPLEEIEIAVNEESLRAYNLSFRDVSNAVAASNLLVTGGNIKTDDEEYLIRAKNRSYYGKELEYIVVKADVNGKIVYLHDVASVSDKWNENPNRSYYNKTASVQVDVSSTNNQNYIAIANKVVDYINQYNQSHNQIILRITSDRSIVLKQRSILLAKNGAFGILLILLLLSLFLKPRIALWVAVGLPISFLALFMIAPAMGITINVLSLFGMIIVIGILVDDGIVIAENIYHHFEQGKKPIRAAIDGVLEVVPPVTSAIITTLVAFSTFFFLEGRIGEFFGEVAAVVIITLSVSLVEAIIILPAHLAHSKALSKEQKSYIFNVWADNFMSWMRDKLYAPTLSFFLKYKVLGFAIPISLMIITIGAIKGGLIRTSFFPLIASDRIEINLEMPQGTSESITTEVINRIEDSVLVVNKELSTLQDNNLEIVRNIIKKIGPGASNASLTINLLPGEDRALSSDEITNAIQQKVGIIPSAENLIFGSGSNFAGSPISVSIVGNDLNELKAAAEELKQELEEDSRLKNVMDSDPEGIKEIRLQLKDKAYLLGLSLNDVMSQVRSAFFGMQVQRFQRGQDEIKVWVRYDRKSRSSFQNLTNMRITTKNGSRVPLTEIADYTIQRGEISINHIDGKREIEVSADLKNPKEGSTEIMENIKKDIFPSIQARHPEVSALFEGQNREALKTINSAKKTIPIILILIYAIIAFTFRSYGQPLMLMLMLPLSFIGVGWGHFIHGSSINILSFLGIIALIGIIVNDGLVLIGKFNDLLRQGQPFNTALINAGKSRFRAIFLTSVTTVAGLAPLIFETSRQAQFLIPMAIAIAYGIIVATFLTLLMLPLLLSLSNKMKVLYEWFKTGVKPSKEEVERAIKEQKLDNSNDHE